MVSPEAWENYANTGEVFHWMAGSYRSRVESWSDAMKGMSQHFQVAQP